MKGATLTEKRLKSRKWPVIAAAAVAAVADIFVITALGVGGFGARYFVMPCLLLALDIVLIALSAITNFRFRYSAAVFTGYGVAAVLFGALGIVIGKGSGSGSPLTTAATVLWLVMHIVTVAVIVLTSLYAAKIKGFSFAVAAVAMAAVVLVAALYSAFLFDRGFFGQQFGDVQRTLTYRYVSETDSYEVTGALEGKGETAVIPETFNGKEVSSVNASLLTTEGISSIYIQSGADTVFKNTFVLTGYTGEYPSIYIDKDEVDEFRTAVYAAAYEENSEEFFSAAANILPCNLDSGEVYVIFKYDLQSYSQVEGNIFPTWFGRAGERFDISVYEDDFPYVMHSDKTSDVDLHWNYLNFGGIIFTSPSDEAGNDLSGQTVREGVTAQVSFEKIYKVYIGDDNDEVYETALSYKQTLVDGQSLDYRYAVPSTAQNLIDELPERDGFTNSAWNYSWTEDGIVDGMATSLGRLLEDNPGRDSVIIYPQWSVNDAEIVLDSVQGGTSFTYGDEITLQADATAPAEGFSLAYSWRDGNGTLEGEEGETLALGIPTPSESGRYYVTVTATAPEITSLQSETTVSVRLDIARKEITLEWTLPDTYTGATQYVSCSPAEGSEVGDDVIDMSVTGSQSVRNAGDYYVKAVLYSDSAENYTIAEDSEIMNFTVAPAQVSVTWGSDVSFTYNGSDQYPAATVNGVGSDGDFAAVVIGNAKDVGTHTVTASSGNGNYIITNYTAKVTITPREITVGSWENSSFIYNGTRQYPLAAALNNEVSGEEEDVLSGLVYSVEGGVDAGSYTVQAALPAGSNYSFSSAQTHGYSIAKRTVTVSGWSGSTLTYNGASQHPVVTGISNELDGDEEEIIGNIVYSGGQTNVGSGYRVTPSLDMDNYTLSSVPYTYSIARLKVTLVWSDAELTYTGAVQYPAVLRAEGAVEGDNLVESLTYRVTTGGINAGLHTVTASTTNGNYTLSGGTHGYTIARKGISLTWEDDRTFTYTGSAVHPEVTGAGGTAGGDGVDELDITYSGAGVDVGSHTVTANVGNTNYTVTSGATCAYSITAKQVTLTWNAEDGVEFTADGEAHAPEASADDSGADSSITYTYYRQDGTLLGGRPSAAGSYYALAQAGGNYSSEQIRINFTIAASGI